MYLDASLEKKRKKQASDKKTKNTDYEKTRVRIFQDSWKVGRPWLQFLGREKGMLCSYCKASEGKSSFVNLRGQNKFLEGCVNYRHDAVTDHEKSRSHRNAVNIHEAKEKPEKSQANQSLKSLNQRKLGSLNSR